MKFIVQILFLTFFATSNFIDFTLLLNYATFIIYITVVFEIAAFIMLLNYKVLHFFTSRNVSVNYLKYITI